ncbi:secretion system protein E (plasmid) [Paraclostridium bifermentans]|uniref:Secretion system protein E n=1 Tax=Paraclostridium bifermentans TaxID=1490 RepID=A0A5P3XKK3_PARBF|nr:secretion system protein E [Paraclostridium bifermentans]QEZ70843.1 secretion system protein E [Paraclostridium bifermentans]
MEPINGNVEVTPYGWVCGAACSAGCSAGGAGCAWICIADGPAPFADAAAWGAIATAAGLSGGAATGLAQSW